VLPLLEVAQVVFLLVAFQAAFLLVAFLVAFDLASFQVAFQVALLPSFGLHLLQNASKVAIFYTMLLLEPLLLKPRQEQRRCE
jgi:hypothetical protein